MKLISLYIDNFGKLSDFSFDFSKEMNTIYEENGWGKTTLTVFIKAMLYGLSKNERLQYTPWKNMSSFGGVLTLEANGKEYRIERQFSPSRATSDTFKIFDLKSGLQIDSMSPNVGESLLNLNDNSFERSVFIPQKDLDQGFGSDIEAKLANLIGGTDDSQSFEEAIEILKNRTHELKLNSKKGLIIDKKMELEQILDEIDECNRRMEGMPLLQRNIAQIDSEITHLTEDKKKYNNQILSFSKTQDKRAKLEVVAKYEQDIKLTQERLAENNQVFNGHNVTVEEVMAYRSKNKELQSMRTQYEVKKKDNRAIVKIEKLEKESNLTDVPDDETLEDITEKIFKYNNIKSVIISHKEEKQEKIKPKAGIALTILAAIFFVVGIGLFFAGFLIGRNNSASEIVTPLYIAGMAVAIIGIALAIAALAAFIVTNQKNAAKQVGGQVGAYDYEKIHLEEEIREFFGKYHIYSSDFTNNLFKIRTNVQRYKDAKAEEADISLENKALEKQIKDSENAISHFLGQFNSSPSCSTNEEKIGELNTHLRKRGEIEAEIHTKETILKTFIERNSLDSIDDGTVNVEELNQKVLEIDERISELQQSKNTYMNKYSEYENEIAMYDDFLNQKAECEDEIRKLEEEFRLMSLSMDYLTLSQNSLLEKYVSPMKDSVNKYVSLLLKDSQEYSIDVNFKFQFVTNTGLKSIDSYSRGYQTIISLCMRLALIDCLYPGEKPFIILDDPFVNFDDEKLELCKALILAISKQYQIMYFTCHKSREITTSRRIVAESEDEKKNVSVVKPVVLNPTANAQGVTFGAPVKAKPKTEAASAPSEAPRVKGRRLSAEDQLVEDLTYVKPDSVKPASIKVAPKRTTSSTASGAIGPTLGKTTSAQASTSKQERTIKITKK